jgi:hypothetical protein
MPTLKNAVNKELKRWQATNPRAGKFSHSLPTSWTLAAGRRPMAAALILLVLFSVVAMVTWWKPPPYRGLWNFGPDDIDKFSVDTLFTGLWATQATLVALVYPVAFGFATIFLQKSHATKASLQSYLVTSGAKLTGTCGLAHLLCLTVLAALVSAVPHWTSFAWLLLGASLLCVNIALTGKFLLKTFAFAAPEARRRERHRYAVTVAWPSEWCRHAAAVVAVEPVRFGLLRAEALTGKTYKGTNPVFHAGHMAVQEVVDGETFTFKGRRLVVNVHYWLVQIAYDLWLRRVGATTQEPPMPSLQREGPIFVLRAWPSPMEAEHGEYLAGTTKAPHLSWLEKFLLRWAVSYADPGLYDSEITVRDCLDEVRAELTQVVAEGASDDFDRQLLALLTLLDDLLEASYFVDDDGSPSCQALTTNSDDHFTGTPVLAIWLATISDLLKSALAKSATNPYFASKLVAVPKRLLSRERDVLSHPVRLVYLNKQHELLEQVLDWGATQHMQHFAASGSDVLPEPLASRWHAVLVSGVGAWESLKNEAILPYRDEWSPWGEAGKGELDLLARHLELSAASLAAASRRAGSVSLTYLIDLLLRWKSQLAVRLERNNVYIDDPWDLTIDATARPWDEVKAAQLQGHSFGDDEALMLEAWSATVTNYWRDCLGALAATVAEEFPAATPDTKLRSATVLGGLLYGKTAAAIPDGGADRMRPFTDANEFLLSLVRQHVVDGGFRAGYRQRLDRVVKATAKDSDWSTFVPGRTISVRAADSLEDVRNGQLMCLSLLAEDNWTPSVAELKAVFGAWSNRDARRAELDDLFEVLLRSITPEFENRFEELWNLLRPGMSFQDALARVREALTAIRAALHEVRTNDLAAAPINEGVLAGYAATLSEKVSLESRGFPFSKGSVVIADSNSAVQEAELRFTGYPKGRLTEPRLAPGSLDEPAHLAHYLVQRIRGQVIEVLTSRPTNELPAGSKGQLLDAIKAFKKNLGTDSEPVLLVPSLQDPEWLAQLRPTSSTSVADSSTAFLERRAGYREERNYVGHIEGAAVYTGLIRPGYLYLLPNQLLEMVTLCRQENGQAVAVSAVVSPKNATLCDLTVRWRLVVTRHQNQPVWQLPYNLPEPGRSRRRKSGTPRRKAPQPPTDGKG